MYEVIMSGKARQDIKDIAQYISKDNPERAVSFVEDLVNNFSKKTSLYPKSGIKRGKFYYSVHKKYLIFYRIFGKQIYVAHIIHSSRYTAYKNFIH